MITATDQPDVAQYSARAREYLAGIMAHWKPCGEAFEVPPQTSLFAMRPGGAAEGADVFCVRGGQLSYIREEKPIVHYDEGSLVGLLGEGERDEIQVRPTFDDRPTTVAPFRIADLRGELSRQPDLALLWHDYNRALLRIMAALAEHHMSFLPQIAPRIERFDAGATLMHEGESPTGAYFLLSGKVKVLAGGATVGAVEAGRLLGHYGLFKGGPRTATVVAERACDALALGEQELLGLLQVRPDLCREVLGQLAATVGELNIAVSGLT